MLRVAPFALALLLVAGSGFAQSPQHPPTQNKNAALGTNKSQPQPTPTVNFPTAQEMSETIANGVNRAREEYDAKHPAPPPDNSAWWFNFWLVVFTGGLVLVGAGQCYLIFRTLGATTTAANAAKK